MRATTFLSLWLTHGRIDRSRYMPIHAFCAAFGLATVTLVVRGLDTQGLRNALQVTARFSFLLFLLAYAGGALGALFGSPFQSIARHGRGFGLAFASAHSIHLMLVVWLYVISPNPPIAFDGAIFFSIGLVWTYTLAALSIDSLSRMLNPSLRRSVFFVGLEYIEFAFLTDFWVNPRHASAKQLIGYLPFAGLGILGTALRLLKWSRQTCIRIALL
jgi:hypothetical protein